VLSAALVLAACGGADDDAADEGDTTEDTEDTDDADDEESTDDGEEASGPVGEGETVSIGWMPWEEAIAVTNLWTVILE